jgi:hypothetical protein
VSEGVAMDAAGPRLEVGREAAQGDGRETRCGFQGRRFGWEGVQILGVVAVARRRECCEVRAGRQRGRCGLQTVCSWQSEGWPVGVRERGVLELELWSGRHHDDARTGRWFRAIFTAPGIEPLISAGCSETRFDSSGDGRQLVMPKSCGLRAASFPLLAWLRNTARALSTRNPYLSSI